MEAPWRCHEGTPTAVSREERKSAIARPMTSSCPVKVGEDAAHELVRQGVVLLEDPLTGLGDAHAHDTPILGTRIRSRNLAHPSGR